MAYPASVITRTCTVGGATAQESGDPLILSVVVASSRGLIWAATGWRLPSLPRTVASTVGSEATFELPVTSQAGYRSDGSPGTIIDVSAPGSYSHTYTATVTITTPAGKLVSQHVIGPFPLPAEDLSPVDLDTMLPVGTVAGGAVLVPDSWSARLDALEAGGGGGGGGFPVQRATLTASGPVDSSGWPTGQAVTLILTQDTTGGHTVDGITVDPDPGSVTVTAWVWTGDAWRGFSDYGTAAPASAPVWPAGMTATTGDPTETDVVVTFSAAIPAGALQVRFGASDAWRTVTTATATTATLSGLAASTAYAAPQFQVINSVGATTALSAQAFTTDAPLPVWTTLFYDSFTDADGTLLSAHTPDVGTRTGTAPDDYIVITGGQLTATSAATAPPVFVATAPTLNMSCRVTCDYDLTTGSTYTHPPVVQFIGTNNFGLTVQWQTNTRNPVIAPSSGATETTGRTDGAPTTGTMEVTAAIGVIELRVNGDLLRRWEHPEFRPGGTVLSGAQAIDRVKVTLPYNGNFTPKAGRMDNLRIESLQ